MMPSPRDIATIANALQKLCGYIENGTSDKVIIAQDDATGDWFIKVGTWTYSSHSLRETLELALNGIPEENKF